ncbi:CDGSH iron-sulfur domain-containing protein [Actinophytocola gossypii]|uniref:CDGSH iron-sulfur domain-containing protein n=1 Tax=Actinophytocola gossypii TaxID=2812003 RepID=A0ABT2JIF9_9PSEU|nr:CDGSH iron-sulfur domain-containing protein [Actinophytocola gossypii]MCT2587672.1 CDGSH iron-sulfur domain-containing protein [Actinophytocola gossypii]
MNDPTVRRRVRVAPDGPVLVEGPVELVGADGKTVVADRFVVAVCTCRRSKRYPLCDTSHRKRVRDQPGPG